MNKPSSPISFLLILLAGINLLGGLIASVQVYRFEASFIPLVPSISGMRIEAGWLPLIGVSAVLFGTITGSVVLAALAQITESAITTATLAEAQADYLKQIVARLPIRAPGVDETARSVADSIRLHSGHLGQS
jgi:hypothetical protein